MYRRQSIEYVLTEEDFFEIAKYISVIGGLPRSSIPHVEQWDKAWGVVQEHWQELQGE